MKNTMLKKGRWLSCRVLFLVAFLVPVFLHAADIARLQAGVVKLTAKPPQGTANVGTGFIVRADKEAVYIVTAAHVVAGDTHPKVEFFTRRNMPVTAEVLGLEGDDEVRGLALLVVRGLENLPKGLTALSLAGAVRLTGGEDIMVIGFPRNAGPWAIVKGNISSRQGRDIYFSPTVESGHSGGPIFQGGKVVGVVGSQGQSVGRGVTVGSVEDYLEGFGITTQEHTSSVYANRESSPSDAVSTKAEPRSKSQGRDDTPVKGSGRASQGSTDSTVTEPSSPLPATMAKPPSPPTTQAREIVGKDGAPMVLVPSGEFKMGSLDGEGYSGERPQHTVYLDIFNMDKFEVTVGRYAEFLRATKRKEPKFWDQVATHKRANLPVVGVDWNDADDYCRWAGKRLPTEAEWEKASRGTDGRTYPWGNEAPTPELAVIARGYSTNIYEEKLEDVDSYEAGKSPYGLHHMAGNVWEWVADWSDSNYYSKSPARNPKGPSTGQDRVLRGGSGGNGPDGVRSASRYSSLPTERDAYIGFRCAQDIPQ